MSGHTERAFEIAIEAGLTSSGGYETRKASAYDERLGLFPDDVCGFLRESQPAKWQGLESASRVPKTGATVLDTLVEGARSSRARCTSCATASSATARPSAWPGSGRTPR